MFDEEKNGYKKSEVDYYIHRLDEDFQTILKSHTDRLEMVRHNVSKLSTELNQVSKVVPKYKTEIESLRERIHNMRKWAENASRARFGTKADTDAVLANLINCILEESDQIQELKLVNPPPKNPEANEDFFAVLATNSNVKLEDALKGFEFYDNNPYKKEAEKRLAKIEKKKQR